MMSVGGTLQGGAGPRRTPESATKPMLVFCHSERSGSCRRTLGFLAQVLQRNHNHATFRLRSVDVEKRPDLAARLRVEQLPTLLVVEGRHVVARLEAPRGVREIEALLHAWLRRGSGRGSAR